MKWRHESFGSFDGHGQKYQEYHLCHYEQGLRQKMRKLHTVHQQKLQVYSKALHLALEKNIH
ncbi:hypothetical protein A9Q02_14045 [Candidatus Chloroploca asiatica]|uniref:Uncharacterized protein n=1 Tax=Candidatus Chloroploca asiatica TaxID=1506545 RepID=A0A2H3L2J0_9CHLR|nr:hypothetical protein A9Q02_14045 [Candidatus Chloroploca asiatica]